MSDQQELKTEPVGDRTESDPRPDSSPTVRRLGVWGTFWNLHVDPVAVGRSIAGGGQIVNGVFFTLAYLGLLYVALFVLQAPLVFMQRFSFFPWHLMKSF